MEVWDVEVGDYCEEDFGGEAVEGGRWCSIHWEVLVVTVGVCASSGLLLMRLDALLWSAGCVYCW